MRQHGTHTGAHVPVTVPQFPIKWRTNGRRVVPPGFVIPASETLARGAYVETSSGIAKSYELYRQVYMCNAADWRLEEYDWVLVHQLP